MGRPWKNERRTRKAEPTFRERYYSLPPAIHVLDQRLCIDLRDYGDVAAELGLKASAHLSLPSDQINPAWRKPHGAAYRAFARGYYLGLVEALEKERDRAYSEAPPWKKGRTIAQLRPSDPWLAPARDYFMDTPLHEITAKMVVGYGTALNFISLRGVRSGLLRSSAHGRRWARYMDELRKLFKAQSGKAVPVGYNPVTAALRRRRKVTWVYREGHLHCRLEVRRNDFADRLRAARGR